MAYQLPGNASIDWLITYCGVRYALFGAKGAPAGQQKTWGALLKEGRVVREHRDDVRIVDLTSRATVRLRDAELDPVIFDAGGEAFLAAGRVAKNAPYADLFGVINPSRAMALGPVKALAFVLPLAKKVAGLKARFPKVAAYAGALESKAKALAEAWDESNLRRAETAALDGERAAFLLKVEKQIALTEVALLTAHPGNDALVRAYLAWDESDEKPTAKEVTPGGSAPQPPA